MLEEYLYFRSVPNPGNKISGMQYYYQYNGFPLCSIDVLQHSENHSITIQSITTDYTIRYSECKFEHLGTRIVIDMLIDMVYRLNYQIVRMDAWLSYADNLNGNWKRSLPFYINLPKWISAVLPCEIQLYIKDCNKISIDQNVIMDNIDLFCAQNHGDLFVSYHIQWKGTEYIPNKLPLKARRPEMEYL